MPTLVLLRHGQSQWNLENRFTGWLDVDLSPAGVDEARAAGQLLKQHGFDFDTGLDAQQRAQAWAIERMLEDHLYFAILHARWLDDENWAKGPSHFFDGAPEGVAEGSRERVRQTLHGHGLGRHRDDEIVELGTRSIAALSAMLGDKQYLFGDTPCGADATAFAFAAGVLTPFFDTPLRKCAESHGNLAPYCERMMRRYYPEFIKKAA